ncbi:pirin family protein [Streptomyces sp. NBC_00669]|uniref:pirin family protein n=1 Tax=Streptomyces sp. NBC_00669 TaxID=2976011 RepID=UPI002E2ED90D|nr:pirin family protein [Streptomyces sp. NBC_00669]
MSNLDVKPSASVCGGREDVSAAPVHELLTGRTVPLGESTQVRRLLPNLGRRMIGAWCFVDHYGPDDIAREPGMQVPPHPHMGLQTVSWLHDGEVLHRDSLGSKQTVRPRELGLMTSGRGISHSEESPRDHARYLHGAQLWVALPDSRRHIAPAFEHHTELPEVTAHGLHATVILGELDGAASPGTIHSPLVGADLTLAEGTAARLPLQPDFEYAALAMSGQPDVDGVRLTPGSLLYLGAGRRDLPLLADTSASLMLLGGEPFAEKIVMFWNFVGRTTEDIAQAREDWHTGDRFGEVHGYDGDRLLSPDLPPTPLKARGRER